MGIEFYRPVWDEGDVWREETWTANTGSHVDPFIPYTVSYCVFHEGVHYAGPDCEHYNGEDPFEDQPGWTVLDLRKGKE